VEAMILHAASIAAFFVDQVAQAPVQIQCVQQATPESWLKWLLPTIVQTVVSLLSIFAGVCIAVRSFRANKKTEHEQWIRDQKKVEWSALLRGVANVFHIANFNTLNGWNGNKANRIATELEQALEEISIACANCIFLDNFRQNNEGGKKIAEFIKNTKLQAQKLKGSLDLFEHIEDRVANAGIVSDIDSKSLERNMEVASGLISNLVVQS
jgi:uncharacterized membrane protein YhaH (DUF805 family)